MPGKVTGLCTQIVESGDGSPIDHLGQAGLDLWQPILENTPGSLRRSHFQWVKGHFPGMRICMRTVMGREEGTQLAWLGYYDGKTPAQAARKLARHHKICLETVPEIDEFQGTNEMADLQKQAGRVDMVKWYAEMQAEWCRMVHDELHRVAWVGNHPRGCPSGTTSQPYETDPEYWLYAYRAELELYLPMYQSCNENDGRLVVHEYSPSGNMFEAEQWFVMRHEMLYEQMCIIDPKLASVKMINGEGYIDVSDSSGNHGFRDFISPQSYADAIYQYEQKLRGPRSRQMVKTVVFGGHMYKPRWESFDVIGSGEEYFFEMLRKVGALSAPEAPIEYVKEEPVELTPRAQVMADIWGRAGVAVNPDDAFFKKALALADEGIFVTPLPSPDGNYYVQRDDILIAYTNIPMWVRMNDWENVQVGLPF